MDVTVMDLGSNTFHVVGLTVGPGGAVERRWSARRLVRLGAGALEAGWIDEAGCQRALCAVDELLDTAEQFGVSNPAVIHTVATSVLRETRNGPLLVAELMARFGLPIRILPADEEARLAYRGALSDRSGGRHAVLDLGGGSLQMAVGDGHRMLQLHSLPLGVLRLRGVDVGATLRAVGGRTLAEVAVLRPDEVVLAGGTARLLGRLSGERGRLSARRAAEVAELLRGLDPGALLAMGVPAGRLDTIAPGAALVAAAMPLLGAAWARIAGGGLREGVALDVAHAGGRTAGTPLPARRRRIPRDTAVE